jgi:glycine reductase
MPLGGDRVKNKAIRVVHYLNQFFGGIGGEDKALVGPRVVDGPIGPGMAVQNTLGDRGEVVATIMCGDNYFAEKIEESSREVIQLLSPYQPDVVIAGPAFDAGRYGISCGAVCKAARIQLGIPSVTGMYKESPGVELYRRDAFIVETVDSVRGMADAISKMVSIASRLVADQKLGRPSEEGYFSRGIITNELLEQTGAERVVSMLLRKLKGQPFKSEVDLPQYERVEPASGIKDINSATIALVTDGGLVPNGNPDGIEARVSTRFGSYSLKGVNTLDPEDYEVNHIGYDPIFVTQDPNRLVPVDVMRDLEKEGIIGELHETFYSTAGAVCIVENVKKMGRAIAEELKAEDVSGVILTST